jgi:hypothetical protein
MVLQLSMGKLRCFLLRGFRLLVPRLLNGFLLDHDAVPLHQAGAQHSQSPIDAVMGGDEVTLEPPPSGRCSILLTFEKVNELGRCGLPYSTFTVTFSAFGRL